MDNNFDKFLNEYYNFIIKLNKETNLKAFQASISGSEKDYKDSAELQLKIGLFYSDKEKFEQLKEIKKSGKITESVKRRELELIYNAFAENQFDDKLHKEIIKLSNKIEEKFATFRVNVNGKGLTDNEIDEILENSVNHKELKTVWEKSKTIGETVADDVIELVKLRNKGARSLGFKNYHQMSLTLNEQNTEELDKLFDNLDEKIKSSFVKLKEEIDNYLAEKFNITPNKLMPWHYEDKFFQQGPKIYNVNTDTYFKQKDIVELTRNYFNGINLNIDDLLINSDLYEKAGKYQHAYCVDIDREGDIRVLCNIKPNQKWAGTMLHEFGHAVYDKYIARWLPWELRRYGHIFTTEAVAMLFGRFVHHSDWLHEIAGVSKEEAEKISDKNFKALRSEQLIFTRWVQVMYRFEKAMYENPEQNLNELWWQLVEKYQLLKKPEGRNKPDWASKIHVALYPAYYHNYMLGELLASQLHHYITTKVLKRNKDKCDSFINEKEVGEYLKNLFFSYGALYPWNTLIEKATGEKLNPDYYVEQFA